ncbi:SDR family oxidoreductase [Pendulispora brunnea]|uniref:SDR family oxidoreductase n=1 Tax=Pendulispora brunnea TaxID=2905690 RepID=A0ABZ2K884_9BACT
MSQTKQVALVSGSSRGIGAATARGLGERGYHVIVNYLKSAAAAKDVVSAITSAGGSAQAIQADVRDREQVRGLVEQIVREHGQIDVLVCNANTAPPTFEPFEEVMWGAFIAKFDGELAGAFHLTHSVLPIMRERRAGRIVYISSISGDVCAGQVAHSTAKSALNRFSRHVAAYAGQFGISVNTVAPGSVKTDSSDTVNSPEIIQYLSERSVFARQMVPNDVANVIASVVDVRFAAVTGQIITVDAGMEVLAQQHMFVSKRKPLEPAAD